MSDFRSSAGRFTLTGPPRMVPLLVRARLFFGGFANQFGWIFFGFGMIIGHGLYFLHWLDAW